MNSKIVVVFVLLFVLASGASADSLTAQPGLWKITQSYAASPGHTMPDLGSGKPRCITAHDLVHPDKAFDSPIPVFAIDIAGGPPNLPDPSKQTCKRTEFTETVNSVTFKYECSGDFSITRSGSIRFESPTHYRGDFFMQVESGADFHPLTPEMKTEGIRVGDCGEPASP
jgi:hypothetical protein